MSKQTYSTRYTIDGVFVCEAENAHEARLLFQRLTKARLGELGDLVVDRPMTDAEYAREIEATVEIRPGDAA